MNKIDLHITAARLQEWKACSRQYKLFVARFPDGITLTRELLLKHAPDFAIRWLAHKLLPEEQWPAHCKACSLARADYNEATDTALAAYEEACAPAKGALAKACAIALEACNKVTTPAHEVYNKACATALAAYNKACATALADALSL